MHSLEQGGEPLATAEELERLRAKGLIVNLPDTKPMKWGLAARV